MDTVDVGLCLTRQRITFLLVITGLLCIALHFAHIGHWLTIRTYKDNIDKSLVPIIQEIAQEHLSKNQGASKTKATGKDRPSVIFIEVGIAVPLVVHICS